MPSLEGVREEPFISGGLDWEVVGILRLPIFYNLEGARTWG